MKIKKILSVLILIFVFSMLTIVPISAESSKDYLVDNADMLTASEEEALSEKLEALSLKWGIDIAIATVESIYGMDVWDYAHDFYYSMDYSDTGILLLISKQYRDYAIYTTLSTDEIFSEWDYSSLESAFKKYASQDRFYDSFVSFADKLDYILKYDNRLTPGWIIVAVVVGAAVAGIVIWNMIKAMKSVKPQKSADTYMLRNTFNLYRSRDVYLYSHVSRIPKPSSNSSSRGGRGGSSGRSGGGRSGRF